MSSSTSTVRIIAGKYRGFKLFTPPKDDPSVRPMLDRVRESLFSILGSNIEGATVLDLCSGTGSISLEALSRGASFATFVEKNPRNIEIIKRNIEKIGEVKNTQVVCGELPRVLKRLNKTYNFVFFDPPFKSDLPDHVMSALAKSSLLTKDVRIILERSKHTTDVIPENFILKRRHELGDSVLYFYEWNKTA